MSAYRTESDIPVWPTSWDSVGASFYDEPVAQRSGGPVSIRLSDFTEFAFRVPDEEGLAFVPFSFEGRRHLMPIYNTGAKRILLVAARQVEKSTLVGNFMLSLSCLIAGHKSLYVAPRFDQAKTFSNDRLREPMELSPVLRRLISGMKAKAVLEKQFRNTSKITLRYAFHNADNTRGIPAWALAIDEFQDILADSIPVIEQCTSHAPHRWRRFIYAGTPKTFDNPIETYRSVRSTQGEWVVPCDACGSSAGAGRHWNILGEKNIGTESLICERCGKPILAMHDDAQWAHMVAAPEGREDIFESYRIPQLMVPWKPWSEILADYQAYSRAKFYNEVLGLSFDSGTRPLTERELRACTVEDLSMAQLDEYERLSHAQPVFAGIDWGTGEGSYTVISLATYVDGRFRVFYCHRFTGAEVEPDIQIAAIFQLLERFNVTLIGSDYGGGFDRNATLTRKYGPRRIVKFQYVGSMSQKLRFNPELRRWLVNRTAVMSDVFNTIKRRQIQFPKWAEFKDPCGQDYLNIFSEDLEGRATIRYNHAVGSPDDAFHSLLYAFLASMLKHPRPDILAPDADDPLLAGEMDDYSGPINQG